MKSERGMRTSLFAKSSTTTAFSTLRRDWFQDRYALAQLTFAKGCDKHVTALLSTRTSALPFATLNRDITRIMGPSLN
jgi:hypothetical protein